MTQALCLPLPDDTGDVLASIRHLIATDKAATRRPGGHAARVPEAAAGRDILLPCAMGPDQARRAVPPADRRAHAGTVPLRSEGAGEPAGGTSAPRPAPLRLNPAAMIPPADGACCPLGRLRLAQGQPAADPAGDEAWASGAAGPVIPDLPDALPAPALIPDEPPAEPASAASGAPTLPADTDPFLGLSQGPTPSSNKDMTMHAYPTGVSHLHADPAMTGLGERCHPGPAMAPAAAPLAMAPAAAAPAAEENPLRALLREVVREEFETEMQRRLDDSLRGMIRSEIVVALTEALIRRPSA